jgi:3-deoxy-D-manno-octulosonic-acid transferase
VDLFLAQSEEDARRLVAMGARAGAVRAIGNLKYDVRAAKASWVAELIHKEAAGRPVVVAGSTVVAERSYEDQLVVSAWRGVVRTDFNALLVIAPRHPENFREVGARAFEYRVFSAVDDLCIGARSEESFTTSGKGGDGLPVELIVLDTIGDLAAVYGIADVAFVGGSLVKRGGHNPLEPAQFGVPVVMGPSFENFRDVVGKMIEADGIRIVPDEDGLETALVELLTDRVAAKAMGERGRQVFEAQSGATGRAVEALVGLVKA